LLKRCVFGEFTISPFLDSLPWPTQQALKHARLSDRPETSDFVKTVKAVLFFSTPHYGADWAEAHTALLSLRGFFTRTTVDIAKLLGTNSQYLSDLQSNFAKFRHTISAVYFFEELGMRVPLMSSRVMVRALHSGVTIVLRCAVRLFRARRPYPIMTRMWKCFTRIMSRW
jgi:hypothetical protein